MSEEMIELADGIRHRLLAPRVAFVVGSAGSGGPNAAPISNVMQLSWAPAYVAVAVWHEWTTNANLQIADGFTISVPTAEQREVVWRLGYRYSGFRFPDNQSKIDACGGEWDLKFSRYGPVLRGSVGWLECQIVNRLEVPSADHTLFVGEITRASGDSAVVTSEGQYKRNPNVIAQVTENLFSVSGDLFELPWLDGRA